MDHGFKNKVACVIVGSDVHVFRQGSHVNNHVVIRAPCKVVTASVVTSINTSQMSSVMVATQDNQLWLALTSCLEDGDVRRKTEHETAKSDQPMDTDDIFRDLLSDKAKSNARHPDFNRPQVKSFMPQSAHITLRSEHLLFSADGVVIDVVIVNDLLSVIMDREGAVELHLFKIYVEQQCGEGRNRIMLLESVTTGLDSSSFHNIYAKRNKCLMFTIAVPEITSEHNTASSALVINSPLCISSQLFTVLFGKEAACLNSPVLMLSTDKGCVYSYVVKSVKSVPQKRLNLLCQLDSDIVGISAISVSQPIVDEVSAFKDIVSALASSLRQDHTMYSTAETRTCLVILTATGNGCLFVPGNDYPTALMFSLPHPVKCFIVHGTSVIYSTGKSIEACELKLVQKQDGTCSVTSTVRTLLRKVRIYQLLPFAVNEADDAIISGITCNIDLVSISTQRKVAGLDTKLETVPSLKDLLGNIEQCSSTFKSLKKDSQYIDSLLLQLNIFASLEQNISQKNLSVTNHCCPATADVTYPFITCKSSVQSAKNVYKRNWSLNITLQNSSSVSLSEDWVVVVALCDGREGLHIPVHERFNQSFSVPLFRGLKCKSSLDISLPLDKLLEIHPTPLINITVHFSLGFRDDKRNIPQDLFNKMVKVEIYRDKLDILHFFNKLNDFSSGCDNSMVELPQSDDQWLRNELDKMTDMRINRLKECPLQDGSQILTVRVGISDLACKEHKLNNPSDVLSFLLKDANIQVDKTLGQHIQLEGPHGHLVTLIVTASAADVSDKSSNGVFPFVAALKGENSSLLLQTRAAIKSRLKVRCTDASVLNSQSCRQLRRQLTFLEGVREDLRVIQKRLVTHRKDKDESARLMCEMMDKCELMTNNI